MPVTRGNLRRNAVISAVFKSCFPVAPLLVLSQLPIIIACVLTYFIFDLPPLCQTWLRSACLSPAVVILWLRSVWQDSWLVCIFFSSWLRKLPRQWNTHRFQRFPHSENWEHLYMLKETASTKPQTLYTRVVLFSIKHEQKLRVIFKMYSYGHNASRLKTPQF